MRFGPNTGQLEVLRRAADADGNPTGALGLAFATYAGWTQNSGSLAAVNGQREDPIDLMVRINDSPRNRTITNADRARLVGRSYEIVSVGLPERKSGSIGLTLRQAENA